MPVFSNILAGAAGSGGAGDYTIQKSIRFNEGDSAHLSRTPSTAGNRKTWTFSTWCKIAAPGAAGILLNAQNGTTQGYADNFWILFYGGTLVVGDGATDFLNTNKLRDPSAWYHIVVAVDTTQSAASDRVKIYINGVESEYTGDARSSISQNSDTTVNSTYLHKIGDSGSYHAYFDGYLAETHLVDGQALSPTDFGKFDAGVWNPKKYSGSRGTNGFHLDYSDNSSDAALGYDAAGSNNWTVSNLVGGGGPNYASSSNWTQIGNGLASGTSYNNAWDGNTSSTFLNFLTNTGGNNDVAYTFPGNGVSVSSYVRLYVGAHSNNERQWRVNSESYQSNNTTGYLQYNFSGTLTSIDGYNTWSGGNSIALYAVEVDGTVLTSDPPETVDSLLDSPTNYEADSGNNGGNYAVFNPLHKGGSMTMSNGNLVVNNITTNLWRTQHATIGSKTGKYYSEFTFTGNDISHVGLGVGPAREGLNGFAGQITGSYVWFLASGFYTAGGYIDTSSVWQNGLTFSDVYGIAVDLDNSNISFYKNGTLVGTKSMVNRVDEIYHIFVTIYGGVEATANFGQRAFSISSVPTGFKSLCTTNLPDPAIADSSTAFDVVTYTGNSSNQTISDLLFSPDAVWIKNRSDTTDHFLANTVVGAGYFLHPNLTNAENYDILYKLKAFNSDGFDLGGNGQVNGSSNSYVAWAWDAGSSTVSNTDGSITSQVRANQSAGFSIVTYTGAGTNATVGHGLNAAPEFIITKSRNNAWNWTVYHSSLGINQFLLLDSDSAASSQTGYWNTAPTSSVFGVANNNTGSSGNNLVAYCFAPVEGFSHFTTFTGTSTSSPVFVYCGFKPAFVLRKNATSGSTNWYLHDTARDTFNVCNSELYPHKNSSENTHDALDILSNGFAMRTSNANHNGASDTYIVACFAENPFKYARAR